MKQESNISSCNAVHHVLVTCQVTSTELSVRLLLPFGNKKHNQRSSNLCSSVISTLSSNMKEMFIHTLQLCTLLLPSCVHANGSVTLQSWICLKNVWFSMGHFMQDVLQSDLWKSNLCKICESCRKNTKQIYVSKMMLAWIASCGSRMLDSKAVSSLTPNFLL